MSQLFKKIKKITYFPFGRKMELSRKETKGKQQQYLLHLNSFKYIFVLETLTFQRAIFSSFSNRKNILSWKAVIKIEILFCNKIQDYNSITINSDIKTVLGTLHLHIDVYN